MTTGRCTKLHAVSFGLAFGVLGAIYAFIIGLIAMTGYGIDYVHFVGSLYVGYAATFIGSIIGAIWAFIHGFIAGAIIAGLYNYFCCRVCKKCDVDVETKTKF
jgi:hypothetical protein